MELNRYWVDLSSRRTSRELVDETESRRWGGAKGLALPVLMERLSPCVDPLGPDNVFILAAGLLTGMPFHGMCRYGAYARSPLSFGYGESEAGGFFGPAMRSQGIDAIVMTGRHGRMCYLWVEGGEVSVLDGEFLRGLETGEVMDALYERHGKCTAVVAGPAAERGVRFSCLVNDLHHVNGRAGMGAVMASKNVKAVACPPPKALEPKDRGLVAELQRLFSGWRDHPGAMGLHRYGTSATLMGLNSMGMLPTRNFREGIFEGAGEIGHEALTDRYLLDRGGCFACAVRCKRVAGGGRFNADPRYGGPEYETLASFGCLCGVDDLEAILKAHELCNRFGMDTISCGMTIAWLMECVEEGVLTPGEANLRGFGDAEGMLRMVELIATRTGIGDVLAEGTYRAARRIGGGSDKLCLTIKGQEMAMHDPRGKVGVALGYGVAAAGADHLQVPYDTLFTNPESFGCEAVKPLGILDSMDLTGFAPSKVAAMAELWKIWGAINHLGGCYFVFAPRSYFPLERIPDLVESMTGWRTSLLEISKMGHRGHCAARIINRRLGLSMEDDMLPPRLHQPLPHGPFEGKPIDPEEYRKALIMFYNLMGWDDQGNPTESVRLALGLPLD
ncbi:aldehyde:ferredoxin oxidoreductase [Thermanaerovibrio velox DSM 12556]|uniref:Aldehyde:ferredoxin oxidoreductase n=1 Tax=Thermanaerovibrio velox DSM 12556 TaxID=926567 RepID=H0UQ61_9BACT|nr:aldehyde ferredoxin oxidoreductase C-terminal domain-containing protein [Thermanaerovibrio velox]EHM10699.1 aldehyde:ferredoxin oxidoreductase [Thermanaerovibrio velox DSM 12556]